MVEILERRDGARLEPDTIPASSRRVTTADSGEGPDASSGSGSVRWPAWGRTVTIDTDLGPAGAGRWVLQFE